MKRKIFGLAFLLALVLMLGGCEFIQPPPAIKEGKFDFSITYELSGEQKNFSATYVCEYDGVSWSIEGGDFNRDWKDRVEGSYEGDTYSAEIGKTEDGGTIVLFFGIYPHYFMGDFTGDRGAPEPSLYITYPVDPDGGMRHVGDAAEIEEVYGAKIIGYEYAAPIQNTFAFFK